MPKKLMRCVKKVKAKKGKANPWAVCVKSTGQKPHRPITKQSCNGPRKR